MKDVLKSIMLGTAIGLIAISLLVAIFLIVGCQELPATIPDMEDSQDISEQVIMPDLTYCTQTCTGIFTDCNNNASICVFVGDAKVGCCNFRGN